MKVDIQHIENLNTLFNKIMDEIFLEARPNETFNNLTGIQIRIVCQLGKTGPKRMTDIADHASVSMPSATGVIDRMVKAGLVQRFEDPRDRRVTMVELSPAGRVAMGQINRIHEQRLEDLLGHLNPKKQVELISSFERISQLLEEIRVVAKTEKEASAKKNVANV